MKADLSTIAVDWTPGRIFQLARSASIKRNQESKDLKRKFYQAQLMVWRLQQRTWCISFRICCREAEMGGVDWAIVMRGMKDGKARLLLVDHEDKPRSSRTSQTKLNWCLNANRDRWSWRVCLRSKAEVLLTNSWCSACLSLNLDYILFECRYRRHRTRRKIER